VIVLWCATTSPLASTSAHPPVSTSIPREIRCFVLTSLRLLTGGSCRRKGPVNQRRSPRPRTSLGAPLRPPESVSAPRSRRDGERGPPRFCGLFFGSHLGASVNQGLTVFEVKIRLLQRLDSNQGPGG
jgi:hypothetical protein